MAKTSPIIQNALQLVQKDPSKAAETLISFVKEKGFLLKKEKIEKEAPQPYAENPEFLVATQSEYFYNQNKEALFLFITHTSKGDHTIIMHDYKNAKTFSAYKYADYPKNDTCPKTLSDLPARDIEKVDLAWSYGFDFTR
jgi:hypothetical protein